MRNIAFGDGPAAANRKSPRTLRALFMVLAFGFNLLVVVGAGLYFLNDDDYRHVLIWSVEEFLDSQLEIDGAFSVKFGREVELSAETVRLKANDGSYDLSLGKLHVEQRFASYLSTGTFWINNLSMEDLRAEINETKAEPGQEFDWQTFSLPFLVIEEIQLRNLSLVYTELDQQRNSIELSHFSLDDTDNQGPVKVSAAGMMDEHTLQLDGTLGSLEQLRSMNPSYPIELTLYSGTVDDPSAGKQDKPVIKLNGSVDTTPSGASQVEATFDLAVAKLVPIFSKEINAQKLGHLQGNMSVADVGGRWGIQKIQFAATDTDEYQLRVDGSVENSGKFDLDSELGVPDPAAFGARFGIDLAGYASIKGKGLFSGNSDKIRFQGKANIGRIESETDLTVSQVGSKPHIQGKLTIAELFLEDIGINQRLAVPVSVPARAKPETSEQPQSEASAAVVDAPVNANPETSEQPESEAPATVVDARVNANPETPASADSPPIFDREPLNLTGLQKLNLDLDLSIDQITGADFSIDKLAGQVKLTDGALRIPPMRVTFDGGAADLELAVDTRKALSLALKVTADDLLLGGVVPHLQPEMQIQGKARLHIDIKSKGRSVHELVSALSGDVSLGLDNVLLPRRYVEFLSADGQQPPAAGDAYTALEIDGVVAAKFGSDIDLTAEAVHLRTNDGSYDFTLGKLNLQQNIALFLEKGDLWIDNLSLADLHVEIIVAETGQKDEQTDYEQTGHEQTDHESIENQPPEHDWHEFDWQVSDLPFVLVKNMRLSNISVVYTEGDQQKTASLSSLVLDNDPSEEPMTLSAAGVVNELALKMEGTVGTPAQPRGKNQVYPIDISLSSGAVGATPEKPIIKFTGTIDRTQSGGSRTKGRFDVAVSELMSIFKPEVTGGKLGHLQGSVDFAEVDGRWGMKKLDLDSSDTDLYQMHLDGEVDQSDKFELNSQLEIPDPPTFGAAFGIDLTGYAAYKGNAVLTGNRAQLDYKGQWIIGKTESDTTLTISLPAGKPQITGKFTIPNLYLPDIGINTYFAVKQGEVLDPETGKMIAPEDQTPEDHASQDDSADEANLGIDEGVNSEEAVPDSADSLIIFDREAFDFSGLQAFNLDLEVLIDDITGVDFTIDQLAGQVKLTDGVLRVSPMRLTFEGGTTDLDLLLDTRSTPSFTLKVVADDLELGRSIAELQEVVPVEGKAHLNVDISGNGHSPHEMAADLTGKVSFSLEDAKIPKVYVEFLSADVLGWMARTVTFEDSYTTLHCVMTNFDVEQGVAKSNLMFADGPQLSIEGDATLDLGQETIDMTMYPTQKKRVTASTSTIKITGALADPDVETSSSKAGTAAVVGAAVLVPQVVIPVFLIEQLWKRVFSSDNDTGCADFIAEHAAQQQEEAGQ